MARTPASEDPILEPVDLSAWDEWLVEHAATARGAWLVVARQGHAGLTASDAGDVALCHGWIDGTRRARAASHFLQRYSPRRPGSPWSQVNVERVAGLLSEGRMRAGGLAQVAAAQADGRWAAAYPPQSTAVPPDDLIAALDADPKAGAAFEALGRSARFLLYLPILKATTPARRAGALRRALAALAGD